MPTQINGLPAHVLLIHVVVVLIPVASLLVLLAAWWPAARRRLGLATPVLAVLALAVVPVTTHAGQWLKDRLPTQPAIEHHASLGRGMLIWAIGLAVAGVAVYALGVVSDRQAAEVGAAERVPVAAGGPDQPAGAGQTGSAPARRQGSMFAVTLVIGVLATAIAVGSTIQIYRIGDSGAKAVWTGVGTSK
jgi:hypothetical protein